MKPNNNFYIKKIITPALVVLMVGYIMPGLVYATSVPESNITRSAGTMIDDENIEHTVNQRLSEHIPKGSFTVVSFGKKVLLTGQVPNMQDKEKAKSITNQVPGVKFVWNYLSVEPNEDAGNITNDAYLTSLAKTRIFAQKNVNTNNVKVVTSNKVVYLLGYDVGEPLQVKNAAAGIKSINGVNGVVNLIGQ